MLRKSSTGEYPVGNVLGVHTSSRFRYYFFYLIFRKYENNKIPKCTPFGMKCSKSRRLLGLRPRPRWGTLRRSLRPPSREGLLAFGNRSFAPSALALSPIFPISVPLKLYTDLRLCLPPIFSRPSTKIPDKSPPYKFYLNCSRRFLSGGFCPGWFLSIPPSVTIHLLQQKVKHHFKFHVSYV